MIYAWFKFLFMGKSETSENKNGYRGKIVDFSCASPCQRTSILILFLCDSGYTSTDIIQAFIKKGFFTVGALKTNRILYPAGYKCSVSELASYMKESMPSIHTVTVRKRKQ